MAGEDKSLFSGGDIAVVVLYFVAVLAVGLIVRADCRKL